MNDILIQMVIAALLKSIKNPEKKAKLRPICQQAVSGILLAYHDDPDFLSDD